MIYILIGLLYVVIYTVIIVAHRKAYVRRKSEIERSKLDVLHLEEKRKRNTGIQLL